MGSPDAAPQQELPGVARLAIGLGEPARERAFHERAHAPFLRDAGNDIRATPVAGYVGCCLAISRIDLTARLKEINCPTLIIVGEHDAGTPPEMSREIHANLNGSELKVIPSASHLSNIEQSAAFNDALTAFFKRVAH